ncbi:MAG: 23S rRNA (uracil(1939)-C(5))-methyltransferase RlmD [Clostridia bacterium]|nr:23S rRNA (uracil(1939)-C(5))-methyltransferase RlmD [Clostridia bacterium]
MNNAIGCKYAKKCGGCQLQNMDYERQLKFKQAKAVSLLGKFHRVNRIIGMKNPYNYRNKVQAAFGLTRGGKIVSGVYQSSSHKIVNVDECMIEDKKADEIIVFIRKELPNFKILPYNEDTKRGFLRHILVKRSFSTNQIMVVLVGANLIFPQKNNLTKAILKKFPEITTVVFNINPHKTSMLLAEREQVLYGNGYIEDELCGLKFRISPKSFYQINPVQTKVLYETAVNYADLNGTKTVIDAYCGTGTIGLVASQKAGRVIGVELNKDAVKDAKINAKINGIKNASFYCADAGEFMTKLAKEKEHIDAVFMDPPRAGSDKAFLNSVVKLSPEKVVYISCNIETQKRDLLYLCKKGYKVRKIQPVDMFPHTAHIESVVLLTRE